MKIISANWILTCDENNRIIKDGTVVFNDKILEIGVLEEIEKILILLHFEKQHFLIVHGFVQDS